MPGKKPPSKKPPAAPEPAWQIILLEEIRSQGRATIEAIHGMRDELKREIRESAEAHRRARSQFLEAAVRQNTADICTLQRDVRNLTDKVDNLSSLEAPVSALERCG